MAGNPKFNRIMPWSSCENQVKLAVTRVQTPLLMLESPIAQGVQIINFSEPWRTQNSCDGRGKSQPDIPYGKGYSPSIRAKGQRTAKNDAPAELSSIPRSKKATLRFCCKSYRQRGSHPVYEENQSRYHGIRVQDHAV